MSVLDFIRWARTERGLKQKQLARKLGINEQTLSRAKRGKTGPLGLANLEARAIARFGPRVKRFFREPRQD